MSKFAIERVSIRDPNRCQKMTTTGCCYYKAVPGSEYCPMHHGGTAGVALEKKEMRNLRLSGALGVRARELNETGQLKDLTDEIVLARVILEGLANQIKQPTDVMIFSDKIMSTTKTIKELVESIQKIQEKNKELVDRATLFKIAEGILSVIAQYVPDPDQQIEAGELIYGVITQGLGREV